MSFDLHPMISPLMTLAQSPEQGNWLERLMGLSQLHLFDSGTYLGWRWAMPAWLWMLIIIAASIAAWWSYRHLLGARWARVSLGVLRALIIILIIGLLAGPMLVLPRERVEPDWLIMLVDRSASMQIGDMVQANGSTRTRDQMLRDAMIRRGAMFGPTQLGKDKHVLWLGFDSTAYRIGGPDDLTDAQGQSTAIRTAIQQALQRAAGHPISALVLISDGSSNQATSGDLVHELQQKAVPVFTIPLGSAKGPADVSVAQVQAPDRAFINDPVPVSVWIERFPANMPIAPGQLVARLVDVATSQVLDEKMPTSQSLDQPLLLTGKSSLAGPSRWRVELIFTPEAGSKTPELITTNNQQDFEIDLVDRQLKVLYVEGYPRWDYRYLKNLLLREKSVLSSVLVLSADRGFVQEGTMPITRFPNTAAELAPYDVIILGDVPANYFGTQQLQMIQDHVATTGAGVLWIGGARDNPTSYEATPLASLLPMVRPASVSRIAEAAGPVKMMPTELAHSLQVLELDDAAANSGSSVWNSTLLPLRWMQDVGQLKPTAEVLAMAHWAADDQTPAVMRMRFGAGQSLYVATDDTWRWRFGRGEIYFERFWTQMIRMLARGRLSQDDGMVSMSLSSRRVNVDEPVVITVRLKNQILSTSQNDLIVEVSQVDDASGQVQDTLELQPVKLTDEPETGTGQGDRVYQTTWRPRATGRQNLHLTGSAVAGSDLTKVIEVVRPDHELRQPVPDIARLQTLAADTGGQMLALDDMRDLASLVPNRARRTPDDIREPLWNSALALIVVITLITAEWIGRKLIRLS